ncbi:unnamed protein product [Durusdinium trenchii]|uniref:Exonuclease domain-containing protein n=1 Tax=Durusdinium trenchii TaxID=1381693 RepID=A0ABP0NWB7_9DINO
MMAFVHFVPIVFLAANSDRPWSFHPSLHDKLKEVGGELLANIARQRILKELKKILGKPRGAEAIRMMAEDGVLAAVLKVNPPLAPDGQEIRALECLWLQQEVADFLSDTAPERLSFGSKESSVPRIYPDPLKEVAAPVADQPYDYYAVTDFEATCWPGHCTAELQEIIELPVVLIEASSGKVVGEFQSFVRPVARPKLSSFCTRLTGITQALAL